MKCRRLFGISPSMEKKSTQLIECSKWMAEESSTTNARATVDLRANKRISPQLGAACLSSCFHAVIAWPSPSMLVNNSYWRHNWSAWVYTKNLPTKQIARRNCMKVNKTYWHVSLNPAFASLRVVHCYFCLVYDIWLGSCMPPNISFRSNFNWSDARHKNCATKANQQEKPKKCIAYIIRRLFAILVCPSNCLLFILCCSCELFTNLDLLFESKYLAAWGRIAGHSLYHTACCLCKQRFTAFKPEIPTSKSNRTEWDTNAAIKHG